ncbi:hypothetical protein BDV97DRAFT_51768 [Delphinella strobiligena]|nr:hypothetical protein BDV97DRAFT_51768 [Delphinella strobiligena]
MMLKMVSTVPAAKGLFGQHSRNQDYEQGQKKDHVHTSTSDSSSILIRTVQLLGKSKILTNAIYTNSSITSQASRHPTRTDSLTTPQAPHSNHPSTSSFSPPNRHLFPIDPPKPFSSSPPQDSNAMLSHIPPSVRASHCSVLKSRNLSALNISRNSRGPSPMLST